MADPSTQQIQDTTQDTNPSHDTDTPGSDAATTTASAPANPSGSGGLGPNLVPYTYNQEECRKALAEFVICDEQPFRVVEGHGFRKYSNRLEPRFPIPSRVTVARDCYKLFIEESKKLKAFLKKIMWNSTYLMLEHALKFQKVFDRMEDEDDGNNAYFRDDTHRLGPPMTFDWSNAYVFVQFLKVFYTITLRFSGSLYVTSNSCFHDIAHVHTMLQASAVHQDPLIGEMAKKMKLKYDKYWGRPENMNPLLVIGVVLDPKYKFGYVNTTFNDIYDNDPILCESMKKKVKDTLYLLYDKYSVGVVGEQSEHEEESGDSGAVNHPGDLPMPDFVIANPNPKGKWWSGRTKHPSDQKTDLDKYLETDAIEDAPSFDVLTWWRENATKYKVVSLITRDVLAMPVSTVASESAFSTGGRVLDVFRSSLSPKMTETLICTQNWLSPTEFNFNDRDFDQYEETDSIASDVSGESTVTEDVNMS
ncbi:zinc finger BED domain-containing protein RICESLEEPER 2-like [Senna tora]|uniref:Zinc finger BED domain-containing protein RICESLEEPER 2-like n=1 Tax=Senna tora TaxID=362788 RepID=A0A834T4K0_9FABA|nr:zinc finger BED domain-containing protein RICESLEEPER 2-like [Senna tora]